MATNTDRIQDKTINTAEEQVSLITDLLAIICNLDDQVSTWKEDFSTREAEMQEEIGRLKAELEEVKSHA